MAKFNSGPRGRAPVGVWGQSPQKLNFFSFSEGDCCIKTGGGGHHEWKIYEGRSGRPPHLQGRQGGRPKRGLPRPPYPPLVNCDIILPVVNTTSRMTQQNTVMFESLFSLPRNISSTFCTCLIHLSVICQSIVESKQVSSTS